MSKYGAVAMLRSEVGVETTELLEAVGLGMLVNWTVREYVEADVEANLEAEGIAEAVCRS